MQARIVSNGKVAAGLRIYAWTQDDIPLDISMGVPLMQHSDWINIIEPASIELCGWVPTPDAKRIRIWRSAPQANRLTEPVMRPLIDIAPDIIAFTDNQPDDDAHPHAGVSLPMSVSRSGGSALADINFTEADISMVARPLGSLVYVRNVGGSPIKIIPEPGAKINGGAVPWELKAWTTIRMVREADGWTGF